ncbi:MAG: TetR family transcriptional regulator [Pseudomonadota bacterium]
MDDVSFQRARRPEQKEVRRRTILEAAALVLDRDGLEATSLAAIAAEAGVVKSGLYRYFESREEILLRLLLTDLDAACDAIEARLRGRTGDVAAVAAAMTASFVERPRLCLLISQLSSTLERNVSGAALREVKQALLASSARASGLIGAALPEMGEPACHDVVLIVFTTLAGLWPMTNPSAELATLLEEPDFALLRKDFAESLGKAILVILTGTKALAAG